MVTTWVANVIVRARANAIGGYQCGAGGIGRDLADFDWIRKVGRADCREGRLTADDARRSIDEERWLFQFPIMVDGNWTESPHLYGAAEVVEAVKGKSRC